MNNYVDVHLSQIKERFLAFAEYECKETSPLYFQLSNEIAYDDELLQIASHVKKGQPIPNSFLASIHFLLIKNPNDELASYYPSIQNKSIEKIPFDLFKAFVLSHIEEIKNLISTKIVQTNVVNRCAYIMPIIYTIIEKVKKPTTIIDIGTSLGLTLNFNNYSYQYNKQLIHKGNDVIIDCEIREGFTPEFKNIHYPLTKIGIDQNIIDLKSEDEKRWIMALIWADHIERFVSMDNALKNYDTTIKLIESNQIEEFEKIISDVNNEENLIVYNTHVLYQFPQELKDKYWAMLDRIGKKRDFYYISVEGIKAMLEKYNTTETVIELTTYNNATKEQKLIATTNGHGNWIKWKQDIFKPVSNT
jgi:hypothetical protein